MFTLKNLARKGLMILIYWRKLKNGKNWLKSSPCPKATHHILRRRDQTRLQPEVDTNELSGLILCNFLEGVG